MFGKVILMLTSFGVQLRLQPFSLKRPPNLGRYLWRARRIILQAIRRLRKVVVIIIEPMFSARGDRRMILLPMGSNDDNGAGCPRRAQA